MKKENTTIDAYIFQFSPEIQKLLNEVRQAIKEAAPEATECISYSMPAFRQGKVLVYFAAYANHIGFYPTSSGITNFKDELKDYKTSKGTVQFPLDKPLPIALIKKITKFRVKEVSKK
ncbi:MAG: DUF1801 domain-containing protein [bacterium]